MSKKEEDVKLGNKIRELRVSLRYDQKEFAKAIGATVSALSNWENGRNKPNNIKLNAIAKVGNMSVSELLYGIDTSFFDMLNLEDEQKRRLHEEIKKSKNFNLQKYFEVLSKYSSNGSDYFGYYALRNATIELELLEKIIPSQENLNSIEKIENILAEHYPNFLELENEYQTNDNDDFL